MVRLCKDVPWVSISLILFTVSLLASCAHSTTKQASAEVKAACQSNALLKRYQCSSKKVSKAAAAGDADAQYALAYMYYYGIDIAENPPEAKLWMRRAAAQGQPQAIQALKLVQISAAEEPPVATQSVTVTQASKTKIVATVRQAQVKPAQTQSVQTAKKASPNSYSIQLAASVDLPRLKKYVMTHHLKGKAGYYQACINNTAWYILIYGHYANRKQALQALQALPVSLKKQKPWLKSYETIQAQVEGGKAC